MVETTYTSLRENLASVMDRVVNDREVVIIKRKGDQRVAMLPADELSGLLELLISCARRAMQNVFWRP